MLKEAATFFVAQVEHTRFDVRAAGQYYGNVKEQNQAKMDCLLFLHGRCLHISWLSRQDRGRRGCEAECHVRGLEMLVGDYITHKKLLDCVCSCHCTYSPMASHSSQGI